MSTGNVSNKNVLLFRFFKSIFSELVEIATPLFPQNVLEIMQ